jgi:hypothetical protein
MMYRVAEWVKQLGIRPPQNGNEGAPRVAVGSRELLRRMLPTDVAPASEMAGAGRRERRTRAEVDVRITAHGGWQGKARLSDAAMSSP